jgi:hypothetical protein
VASEPASVRPQVFYKVHIVCFLGIMVFSAIHYSGFTIFVIPGQWASSLDPCVLLQSRCAKSEFEGSADLDPRWMLCQLSHRAV